MQIHTASGLGHSTLRLHSGGHAMRFILVLATGEITGMTVASLFFRTPLTTKAFWQRVVRFLIR